MSLPTRTLDAMDRVLACALGTLPGVTAELPEESRRFVPDPASFAAANQPQSWEGGAQIPPLLVIGGLGCAARSDWSCFCEATNQALEAPIYLHSLPGHDGNWDNLARSTPADWQKLVLEKSTLVAKDHNQAPFVLLFSASANAGLVALASLKPSELSKICRGLIIVSPVLGYRSAIHSLAGRVASSSLLRRPAAQHWHEMGVQVWPCPSCPAMIGEAPYATAAFLPMRPVIGLNQTRSAALDALLNLRLPILVIQGSEDRWTSSAALARKLEAAGDPQKTHRKLDGAGHTCMLGQSRYQFEALAQRWLRRKLAE